jgi:hypothetical protein
MGNEHRIVGSTFRAATSLQTVMHDIDEYRVAYFSDRRVPESGYYLCSVPRSSDVSVYVCQLPFLLAEWLEYTVPK